MKSTVRMAGVAAATVVLFRFWPGVSPSFAAESEGVPPPPSGSAVAADATVLGVNKDNSQVTLLSAGGQQAVSAVLPTTQISGLCQDCGQTMTFPPAQSARSCWVCPCSAPAVSCISGIDLKPASWQNMLQRLPFGSVLRVQYVSDKEPGKGLQSLFLDLKSLLLPIAPDKDLTVDALLAATRSAGVTLGRVLDDGRQIELVRSKNWTAQNIHGVSSALSRIGVTVQPDPRK